MLIPNSSILQTGYCMRTYSNPNCTEHVHFTFANYVRYMGQININKSNISFYILIFELNSEFKSYKYFKVILLFFPSYLIMPH